MRGNLLQQRLLAEFASLADTQVQAGQLTFEQQAGEGVNLDGLVCYQPALLKQGLGRLLDVTDFRISQTAGAKMVTLAHDQAYQQRARAFWLLHECPHKGVFICTQQVRVARTNPVQNELKVAQIVKVGGEQFGHHEIIGTG